MKCPICQNDMIGLNGPPVCPSCARKRNAEARLALTACSPLRAAYSREEMEAKLREWMVKEFGHPSDYINDPEQRNAWYRDNGLLHHFICDHFPSENASAMAPPPQRLPSTKDVPGG